MLKFAYQLGLKIAALEQAAENGDPTAAAELAQVMQSLPIPTDKGPSPELQNPGEPEEDDMFEESSVNYAFDDLSRMGLEMQGPTSTSV